MPVVNLSVNNKTKEGRWMANISIEFKRLRWFEKRKTTWLCFFQCDSFQWGLHESDYISTPQFSQLCLLRITRKVFSNAFLNSFFFTTLKWNFPKKTIRHEIGSTKRVFLQFVSVVEAAQQLKWLITNFYNIVKAVAACILNSVSRFDRMNVKWLRLSRCLSFAYFNTN